MQRVQIKADIEKNRLLITLYGKLSKKDLDSLYTDVRFCVADLKPGFFVITDLSNCTLAALSGIPTFQKITRHLVANRLGLVVRILNRDNLVVRQLLNLTAKMGGYKAVHVSSMEEAEEVIQNANKESFLSFYLHNQLVSYRHDQERGNGIVIEMSTSGCSITSATFIPDSGDQVTLSIEFKPAEGLIKKFESTGEVLALEDDDSFTVRFTPLSDKQKEQLWKRLVHDSQSQLD